MERFTIHTRESAPEGAQDALAGLERNIGFIPHLAATIAESPAAMQGFVSMQTSLRRSALAPLAREVVGLTVSHENSSPYSMAAHSTFAQGLGAPDAVIAALRAGDDIPDPALQALREFTLEVVRTRGHLPEEDLTAFLDAGWSRENALEVVTQVAYTTMANLVANLADTPVDEAFEAQGWAATPA
jgi:alkylhydroperoxidase family enzyme